MIRVGVGSCIGPFSGCGLDEALCFAVGLWRVRARSEMSHAQVIAGIGKGLGDVAGAIIGHDALSDDAQAVVEGDGPGQETAGGFLALVIEDFRVADARGVVDADMDEFPSCSFA